MHHIQELRPPDRQPQNVYLNCSAARDADKQKTEKAAIKQRRNNDHLLSLDVNQEATAGATLVDQM